MRATGSRAQRLLELLKPTEIRPLKSSHIAFAALLTLSGLPALSQDLVIDNARILDGTGNVIERGSVVIENGRIVAVGAERHGGRNALDARGMTVMPGFIDAHRHLIDGDPDAWLEEKAPTRMREFLEAGFTAVFSAIDPTEQILELRRRLDTGEVLGPRLGVGGFVPLAASASRGAPDVDPARLDLSRPPNRPTEPATAIPEQQTRDMVRGLAAAGVDAIKTVIVVTPGGPEKDTLAIVVDEAERLGLRSVTHAVSVEDTLAAVEAGTHVLMHTPHIGQLNPQTTAMIAASGIPMVSTLGVFVPAFDKDNTPLFRDRLPFPMETLSSAGQGPVNARLLWDAGITYGYGTDTSWLPRDSLALELRPLGLVFSPADIVEILTRNAAVAMGMEDEIGTLEPGKLADIAIVNGDPLLDSRALLNVEIVIKGGRIVID
jgi:imidazolonepropionase-like amidohydrolase